MIETLEVLDKDNYFKSFVARKIVNIGQAVMPVAEEQNLISLCRLSLQR